MIDNFGGFREKTRMKYDDIILKYVREGTGYGMYLAVTAAGYGMAEIPEELQIIYGLQSVWNKAIDSDIWKF